MAGTIPHRGDPVAGPAGSRSGGSWRTRLQRTQPWLIARARSALWIVGLLGACALSVLVRLPFIHVPLNSDEGGYAYIASFWHGGRTLYSELWVDRPQLLLLTYQAIQHLFGLSGEALRMGGAVINAASTLTIGLISWRMWGRRWAVTAGLLFAWFSAAPHIEGFTSNGELLTTLPSTVAIGLILAWASRELRTDRPRWVGQTLLLFGAGVCGGCSFLIKQSGVDALGTLVLTCLMFAVMRETSIRRAAGGLAAGVLGAVAPVAISVAQGLITAGGAYWFAIYTYRTKVDGFFAASLHDRIHLFVGSLPGLLLELGPLLVLAPIGIAVLWRTSAATRVLVLWLVCAWGALLAGGSFHEHYYVALVPALVLCAAAALHQILRNGADRSLLLPANAALIAATVWMFATVATDARLMANPDVRSKSWQIFHDPRYLVDRNVGQYLRGNTEPTDRIYVMYAAADVYYYAQRESPYRYLWVQGLQRIQDGIFDLRLTLEDPKTHPDYIAMIQDPDEVDRSGELSRVVDRYYTRSATVDGVPIYRANPTAFTPSVPQTSLRQLLEG